MDNYLTINIRYKNNIKIYNIDNNNNNNKQVILKQGNN